MKNVISDEIRQNLILELKKNSQFNIASKKILQKIEKYHHMDGKIPKTLLNEALTHLSTIRNRNIITEQEQKKLQKTVVGFFGLSVGSHAAITWLMESRADFIKIVDPDTISSTNLNRLTYGWSSIGKRKIDLTTERILALHPFAKVIATTNEDNKDMEEIFYGTPSLDIVVDSVDSLDGKILLRKLAKKKKIPLIMATDVGDNVLLDVERYDVDSNLKFFLGRVPKIEQIDIKTLTQKQRIAMTIQIVGFEKNSEAMLDSLLSVGKTLATWPQVGATATIAGGVITTAIKKIVLAEQVESGRYYISLDEILVSDFDSKTRQKKREKQIKKLIKL